MTNPFLDEQRLSVAVNDWAKQSGRRLQQHRARLKLSQKRLAAMVGVVPQTISKAELGLIVPKDAVRMAIAASLLCEVGDIWPYPERTYITSVARAEVAA